MTTLGLVGFGTVIALVTACLMEPWARFLHGQVWHRALWRVHRSHHTRRKGRFETNDALSGTHAPIAAALIMIGCNLHGLAATAAIGVGAGMTVFGFAYVIVHDGLVHGRLPASFLTRYGWLRRVRDAHAVHHARGAIPYGLFLGPRELKRAPRARAALPSEPPRSDREPAVRPGTRSDGVPPSA